MSLATIPCGYFGGTYRRRGDENIAMLAKMRLVMLEKWEGHCWQDCLKHGPPACNSSCAEADAIVDTHRRVKAINPGVSSVFYWNTALAFPFYRAVGKFEAANALTIDAATNKPLVIRNDGKHSMDTGVIGYDTALGVQLYIDTVKNITKTGVMNGIFGDKWDFGATQNKHGQWQLCNHECGNITATQATAWNAGKAKALAAVTAFIGKAPYFSNGAVGNFGGVGSNMNGVTSPDPLMESGDPRDSIKYVNNHLRNHTYHWSSCFRDQQWMYDPNARSSLVSQCSDKQLARFLLSVEPGCILGTNGWDDKFDLPLGNPLAPAVYAPAHGANPATLNRTFASGTFVTFTYDADGSDGTGRDLLGRQTAANTSEAHLWEKHLQRAARRRRQSGLEIGEDGWRLLHRLLRQRKVRDVGPS